MDSAATSTRVALKIVLKLLSATETSKGDGQRAMDWRCCFRCVLLIFTVYLALLNTLLSDMMPCWLWHV